MTPELILSFISLLFTALLGIILYRLFRKQKEQITFLLKDKQQVQHMKESSVFIQLNNLDNHVLSSLKPKIQEHQMFKSLPFKEKMVYVQNHGTYLAARSHNEYQINLYHLHGFFVEIWYSHLTDNTNGIRTFTSKDCLAVYAEWINLEIK